MTRFGFTVGEEVELTDAEPKSDDRFVVILEIDFSTRKFYGQHEDESCEWFDFREIVDRGRKAIEEAEAASRRALRRAEG